MFARSLTVFLLASTAVIVSVSAAPFDSRSSVAFRRQDDALASMLNNLTSVTVSHLEPSVSRANEHCLLTLWTNRSPLSPHTGQHLRGYQRRQQLDDG